MARHYLIAVMAMAIAGPVWADDMKVEASLTETGVWDSNPLMRIEGAKATYGVLTIPRISFEKATPIADIAFAGRVENGVYSLEELNSTDFHGQMDLSRRTERTEISIKTTGDYDTTRSSELTLFGIETIDIRRTAWGAAPKISYALSPLSHLVLDGSYREVKYDDPNDSKTDYHTFRSSLRYTRKITPQYTGGVGARARRYETQEGVDRHVDSVGPFVELLAQISERWSADINVGQQFSQEKVDGDVTSDWDRSSVIETGVRYKNENSAVSFSLDRSQNSFSNGRDDILTAVSLDGQYRVAPRLSLEASASYRFSDDQDESTGLLAQRATGSVGLTYHVTDSVAIASSYDYRRETYSGREGEAERNMARLSLTYKPDLGGLW